MAGEIQFDRKEIINKSCLALTSMCPSLSDSAYVCVKWNILSTPSPRAKNGMICVVAALNAMPRSAQNPSPAATVMDTRMTPAIPMPLCDLTGSFRLSKHIPTYIN